MSVMPTPTDIATLVGETYLALQEMKSYRQPMAAGRGTVWDFFAFIFFPLGNNFVTESALKLMYIEATPNDSVVCVCWGGVECSEKVLKLRGSREHRISRRGKRGGWEKESHLRTVYQSSKCDPSNHSSPTPVSK